MSDALQRLIDAVEAGGFITPINWSIFGWEDHAGDCSSNIFKAHHGSLDAAKALHAALLPEWSFHVSAHDAEVWHDGIYHESITANVDGNPARAWLLTTLRAYHLTQTPAAPLEPTPQPRNDPAGYAGPSDTINAPHGAENGANE